MQTHKPSHLSVHVYTMLTDIQTVMSINIYTCISTYTF